MPQARISLWKRNELYLIVSCLVFPVSLKLAIFCFGIFLSARILFYDSLRLGHQLSLTERCIKVALFLAIAIFLFSFYQESRIHFYPVSDYDYLATLLVVLIVKIYPFTYKAIQQVCLAIALSPLFVFLSDFRYFDFQIRNNWGFDNANGAGLYCAMCFPFITIFLIDKSSLPKIKLLSKSYFSFLLLVITTASWFCCAIFIISSGSRSALYISILFLLLIAYLKVKSYHVYIYIPSKNLKSLTSLSFYFILSTGFFVCLYQFLIIKLTFINRFFDLANSTNLYRIYIYQCYWELGKQKLWFGWGLNNLVTLCEEKLKSRYGGVNHAHNFILQLFGDRGLIITVLCLIVLAYFIVIPSLIFIFNYDFSSNQLILLGICLSSLSILGVSLFQLSLYHYPLFPLWLGLLWGWQLNLLPQLHSRS